MNRVQQTSSPSSALDDLIRQIECLRQYIKAQAESDRDALPDLPPERLMSAENLLHYLALRREDIRPLQDSLASLGLSSLGRSEPHVLATINAVLHKLYLLNGQAEAAGDCCVNPRVMQKGAGFLESNTTRLFGEHPMGRRAHIIVTMAVEAADDYLKFHQLLMSGMNCMRINCAKDYPEIWSRMIRTLRDAEKSTGRSCRILMDLGGPKLRLGPMETHPAVIKIRPLRAPGGKLLRPARIWLTPVKSEFSEMPAADVTLALDPDWLKGLKSGDRIRLCDARGSKRSWRIREQRADGFWAESRKTTFLSNGIVLQ